MAVIVSLNVLYCWISSSKLIITNKFCSWCVLRNYSTISIMFSNPPTQ